MQNWHRHELQQGAAKFNQGAAELRDELQRQKDINLRLQEQLKFHVNDGPMGVHEMDELNLHIAKVPTSAEGKISIETFDGSEIFKGLGAGFV